MLKIIIAKLHKLDQDDRMNAQCKTSAAKNKNVQIIKLKVYKT